MLTIFPSIARSVDDRKTNRLFCTIVSREAVRASINEAILPFCIALGGLFTTTCSSDSDSESRGNTGEIPPGRDAPGNDSIIFLCSL